MKQPPAPPGRIQHRQPVPPSPEMPEIASTYYAASAVDLTGANLMAQMAADTVTNQRIGALAWPPPSPIRVVEPKMSFRIVQVFIADPNDSLALADRIIYSGTPAPTDLDDNELFFDIDIKSLLATHNAKRVTVQDKTVKDRVQMLEPARIRDLKMQVVTIAQF